MRIRPLADRLVLEKIAKEEKTVSGIIMPNDNKDQSNLALVVAISDELTDISVKVGDKVLYSEFAVTPINDEDKEYLVIRYEDVLAVIE